MGIILTFFLVNGMRLLWKILHTRSITMISYSKEGQGYDDKLWSDQIRLDRVKAAHHQQTNNQHPSRPPITVRRG